MADTNTKTIQSRNGPDVPDELAHKPGTQEAVALYAQYARIAQAAAPYFAVLRPQFVVRRSTSSAFAPTEE